MNFEVERFRHFVGTDQFDDRFRALNETAFFEDFRRDFDRTVEFAKDRFQSDAFDDVAKTLLLKPRFGIRRTNGS